MELRTEVEIAASKERVWAVLTELSAYPEWNPFIVELQGVLEPGGKLSVTISQPETGSSRRFNAQILTCEPAQELRWLGVLGAKILFSGEHFLRLEALEGGKTRVIHGENFKGWLVPYLTRSLERTARGFVYMNRALKRRAEQSG